MVKAAWVALEVGTLSITLRNIYHTCLTLPDIRAVNSTSPPIAQQSYDRSR